MAALGPDTYLAVPYPSVNVSPHSSFVPVDVFWSLGSAPLFIINPTIWSCCLLSWLLGLGFRLGIISIQYLKFLVFPTFIELRRLTILLGRVMDKDCHFLCPRPQVSQCGQKCGRLSGCHGG